MLRERSKRLAGKLVGGAKIKITILINQVVSLHWWRMGCPCKRTRICIAGRWLTDPAVDSGLFPRVDADAIRASGEGLLDAIRGFRAIGRLAQQPLALCPNLQAASSVAFAPLLRTPEEQ